MSKKTLLEVQEKIEICLYKRKNPTSSHQTIADHFSEILNKSVRRRTVCDILREQSKWLGLEKSLYDVKRVKTGKHKNLEDALAVWIKINSKNGIITDEFIKEIARVFGNRFGVQNFNYSNGWLQKFKKRYGLTHSARLSQSTETARDPVEENLSDLVSKYDAKDVYNMDESGLFYKMPPDRTVSVPSEQERTNAKEMVTIIFCTNADGSDKRPLTVIGKSNSFKKFNPELYVNYRFNENAWMTTKEFDVWLQEFNVDMILQKRKVLLLLDDAPCHKSYELSNIHLAFFPAKHTGTMQPMEIGIVTCFKAHYRQMQVKKIIDSIQNSRSTNISLKTAIYFMRRSWDAVKPSTILKYWVNAGLIPRPNSLVMNDDSVLQLEICLSSSVFNLNIQMTAAEFLAVDEDVLVFEEMTIDDIINQVHQQETSKQMESGEEEDSEEMTVSLTDACLSMKKLKTFLEQNNETNREIMNSFLALESHLDKLNFSKRSCSTFS